MATGCEMQLWYLLVGAGEYERSVLVRSTDDVASLVRGIKETSGLSAIEPCQMQIFLAKEQDGTWLSTDAEEVDALAAGDEEVISSKCAVLLSASDNIRCHFNSTELGHRKLHVLVKLHETTAKEATKRPDELELRCLTIGGKRDGVFSVTINKSSRVKDLQVKLKRLRYQYDLTIRAETLALYVAKRPPRGWLRLDDGFNEAQHLMSGLRTWVEDWAWDKLDPEGALEDIFSSCEQGCIHVLILPPATFCLSSKQNATQLQPYQETAERLKNAVEVVKIVRAVKAYSTVDDAATAIPPFILLQGSAGMGMTQMAFNLMAREDLGVLYIPCSASKLGFDDRYEAFMGCVKKDMLDVGEASAVDIRKQSLLYTYGFVWALLSGVSSFTGPRRRDEVVPALKAWRTRMGDKCCVFFLDDVEGLNLQNCRHAEFQFRFIVNLFRSLGFVAILSAPHLPTSELREIAKHSGNSNELWAIVFPSFPRFCDPSLISVRPDLRKTLWRSRPLFAKMALEFMRANPLDDGTDLVTFLDEMANTLALDERIRSRYRKFTYFSSSQMRLFLASSYGEDSCTHIFDHYTHAYESDAYKLWITPRDQLVQRTDTWWKCASVFPAPEDEPLLHLCLSGCKGSSACRDSAGWPISFRQAFHSPPSGSAAKAFVPSSRDFGSLAAGAIVAASRHNGLAGLPFVDFFSGLLYELGLQRSSDIHVRFPSKVVAFLSSLTVPFLAPPGVKWPKFLLQMPLNLGTLRCDDKNGGIYFLDGRVSVECISSFDPITATHMKKIVTRIPRESLVHFAVVHSIQSPFFCKRKRRQNGDVVDDNFRKRLPESLRHAHFYRIGRIDNLDETGSTWRNELEEMHGRSDQDVEFLKKGGDRQVTKVVVVLELEGHGKN